MMQLSHYLPTMSIGFVIFFIFSYTASKPYFHSLKKYTKSATISRPHFFRSDDMDLIEYHVLLLPNAPLNTFFISVLSAYKGAMSFF
jgi:hypothetical protein